MIVEATVKTVSVGERSFITQLPSNTSIILAWNAVWKIRRYPSTPPRYGVDTGPVLLPSGRIVVPLDYWGILSTPGSEPLLAIDFKVMDACAERSSGKHFYAGTRTVLAKMDGTAYNTGVPYVINHLCQQTKGVDNAIDQSQCSQFQLTELIGEKQMAKLQSTMRTKLRKSK